MIVLGTFIFWLAVCGGAYWVWKKYNDRWNAQNRLFNEADASPEAPAGQKTLAGEALGNWLVHSGFSQPQAYKTFIWIAAGAAATGILVGVLLDRSLWLRVLIEGEGFLSPIWALLPWTSALAVAGVPWVVVLNRNRKRKEEIENDLPLLFELLATLSEAGLAFDEALSKVLIIFERDRAVPESFRVFQNEILSGRPRIACFLRLSDRLDVPAIRAFVAALVQSEQVGGRVTDVLRHQSTDALNRRRMRAMELSMSLPVRLLLPLFICFFPGIFVSTLGPVLHQFLQIMDSLILRR